MHKYLLFDFSPCICLCLFFLAKNESERGVCCTNTLCQEAVRYRSQECMKMIGFDSPQCGPELSQTGDCFVFYLLGPRVTLVNDCKTLCAWMLSDTSCEAARRWEQRRSMAPVFNIQISGSAKGQPRRLTFSGDHVLAASCCEVSVCNNTFNHAKQVYLICQTYVSFFWQYPVLSLVFTEGE